MSIMFKSSLCFESDDQNKPTRSRRPKPTSDLDLNSCQSVVMKKQTKQKDFHLANKIAKNDFFATEDAIFCQSSNTVFMDQVKTQTVQSKSPNIKRKKVSTSIKLQPLNTLQLKKNVQKIQFIQAPPPPVIKRQSEPVPAENSVLEQQIQISQALSSVYRSNLLNFEMNSSSSDEDQASKEMDLRLKDMRQKRRVNQPIETLFFEEEDDDKVAGHKSREKKGEENKPELKQLKFKRSLKKKSESADTKQPAQQIPKQQSIIFNPDQQEKQNSQNSQNEAKVGVEAEPNPQNNLVQPNSQQPQLQVVQHQKQINFDTMKRLILADIQKHQVLNLRMHRVKSILNFFSPEFRLEFFEDKYFVLGCKKTSSKPMSTFVFTCSQFNFEQTSKKYMGKMKSNIAGNVYNIFGPGMNPSNAKANSIPPRQLLATVVYKTELFGTGRPKEFSVYIKKPDLRYYHDFIGVKMYDDEVPLHELYYNHPENMGRIQILNTRKPTYFKETKQYVMNFEGKVKKSSIKNFILEDRDDKNAKTLLFGKVDDDDYVLDVLNPLSPLVGIGIVMTVFDTRMGSD